MADKSVKNREENGGVHVGWKEARALAGPVYGDERMLTGERLVDHADGMLRILQDIRDDEELLAAAALFGVRERIDRADEWISGKFGSPVLQLVTDLQRLQEVSRKARSDSREAGAAFQPEALRRMLLAMCHDLRVILLRLASRLQTLRWFRRSGSPGADAYGRETLALYAPLANRLGIWQMKWELEDLSLRFSQPEVYADISRKLEETREQRVEFMQAVVDRMQQLLRSRGIEAEVSGRPKHIYSIYKKMARKSLAFEQLFDIRALRVIVDTVSRCYEVLSIVQANFNVLSKEYDDYIANPKPNGYQSLHTVISDVSGKPVEVQIRTRAMHEFAELGIAAHWRYKETGNSNRDRGAAAEEQRVAWLRQLLAWRSDAMTENPGVSDDHVYCITPQGRVVELQSGGTPIDFAYQVHTELGHRCRGARVNGTIVPLNTKLSTGQTVEIIAAKTGGPSRDWLNPELGYAASQRTRSKVRQWFNAQTLAMQTAAGRDRLDRELARLGKTATKLEDLAKRLGFDSVDALCVAFAREEVSLRALEQAVQPVAPEPQAKPEVVVRNAKGGRSNVLVVGMDSLLTKLARCCHPAPPDEIIGFVTRGKGVTVHRIDCPNVRNLEAMDQERIIEVSWGGSDEAVYPVDVYVVARDRIGLFKDISEVFMRERQNIIGMNTTNVRGDAHIRLSVEVHSAGELVRSLHGLLELKGVMTARRA